MNLHFRDSKYFDGKVSHGFVSLFISKAITNIATGFFNLFLPIYFYITFDEKIGYVALYYLATHGIYALFVAYGSQFLNKFGFRKSLQASTFLGALYYLELYFLNENTTIYIVPLLIITISLWKTLYWVPFHVDFAKFTDKRNRGKEVGIIESTLSVIGIVAPIVAGVIVSQFGFNILFVLGVAIYVTSLIPFLTIPRTKEKFSWSYLETWKQFFSKKNRHEVVAFIADGAESAVGIVVWPIFIYQLLMGDFLKIGAISTIIVATTVFLQLFAGRFTDKRSKRTLLKYGSIFYSFGWIFKIFIATAFQIFLVDTFHKLTKIFLRIPFDAMTYDIAADHGHFVDEFSVLHEISINIGRVIMYSMVIVLTIFVPLNWIFVLAAFASIAFNFLYYKHKVSKFS